MMIYNDNCIDGMKKLEESSVDLIVTDPPYGMSFMGKNWDKALPDPEAFKQMHRVLKPGAFAFVMCAPRSDLQARMSILLEDAGFDISFTPIYWTFATGFPKAQNISKQIDKRNGRSSKEHKALGEYLKKQRTKLGLSTIKVCEIGNFYKNLNHGAAVSNWELGKNVPTMEQWKILKPLLELDNRFDKLIEREEAEREIIGLSKYAHIDRSKNKWVGKNEHIYETADATHEAQKYNGAYAGFQPKPAVEVVIVAMKPRTEKTYVDQCLNNGHGITWLDDCRIPTTENLNGGAYSKNKKSDGEWGSMHEYTGKEYKQPDGRFPANLLVSDESLTESYGRFFDLDAWFAIIPKPSKKEKNEGLEQFESKKVNDGRKAKVDNAFQRGETQRVNTHPTVKPIKLMSYLITLGSRPGQIVLDPFMGSGTTGISAKLLKRKFIGYEMEPEYYQIAEARIKHHDQEVLI